MAHEHVKKKEEMSLVLSSDAKPRLKWTPELHRRFIHSVDQLGGADKATPKSLMRVMGVRGLTLYHLKSHLQKYRLGKSQESQINRESTQQVAIDQADCRENQRAHNSNGDMCQGSSQIAQALQVQMEVQRKLHEQIEVQRHLQLRIEAQGKYLRSVLMKAQETLAGYNSSTGMETAKSELSRLVSMVETGCPSNSLSVLTEIEGSTYEDAEKKASRGTGCSLESSLTSSESWETKEEQIQPCPEQRSGKEEEENRSAVGDDVCVEQPPRDDQQTKFRSMLDIDLNMQCVNELN